MLRVYFIFLALAILTACETEPSETISYRTINGKTMGTTYVIKYSDSLDRNFQPAVEQLLKEVNAEVNTYDPQSFISTFNQASDEVHYLNLLDKSTNPPLHFKANLEKAQEIYELSYGFFDPTIMPIVNYWGFGYTEKRAVTMVDEQKIDSLITYVGFDKIRQRSAKDGWIYLGKTAPGVQLDFSAIAKGYAVDVIAEMLVSKGIHNYYVEIGGDLRVKGKSPSGEFWKIGVNTPSTDASLTDIQATVLLQDEAMTTSGNYRNYYEVDGLKYAHTINPKTGFPEKNTLLSTSIFASDCMTADGFSTACMTLGLERSKALIESLEGMDAYFIYSDSAGRIQTYSTNPDRALEVLQ